jgi:hypothetical protein
MEIEGAEVYVPSTHRGVSSLIRSAHHSCVMELFFVRGRLSEGEFFFRDSWFVVGPRTALSWEASHFQEMEVRIYY